MMAQSPLFSTNPNIGTKLQWLNLYHTALVFVQKVPGGGWGAVVRREAWGAPEREIGALALTKALDCGKRFVSKKPKGKQILTEIPIFKWVSFSQVSS